MSGSPARRVALFGLLSLVAVAMGCGVAQASGVPAGVWVRNPASWAVGAAIAAALMRFAGFRTALAVLALAPLGLFASLWTAGQLGVHRWLDVGPLHMNAAQILLPPAIAACAAPAAARLWPWLAAAMMILLVAQPDASQATALGGALFALIGERVQGRLRRVGAFVAVGVAMAAAWLRPDPLAPVPEVEEIMRLAGEISPLVAVAAWGALLAAVCAVAVFRRPDDGGASRALCAYAILSALMPVLGPFPVPLVGMAMSPILGLWLGVGLLAAPARRSAVSANSPAASAA